jgi:transcriptional regulator with XRE-family HTH domain
MKSNRTANASDAAIGNKVRMARLEAKMSQMELGDHLGVTFQQIQKYEKGSNRVSARDIVRIGQILNRPVEWFVGSAAIKPTAKQQKRSDFLATREGNLIVDITMTLPQEIQNAIITLARNLAHGV